ncbi:MAG: YsnF/AvaK domain-containing protein [Pseudomonadota bacterium]
MQHTLVAVFDNRGDAQKALEELVNSGYSRDQARLSEGDPAGDTSLSPDSTISRSSAEDPGSFVSSIRNFFTDIFGTERDEDARVYSEAVNRGHYVLTVVTDSMPEVERAADLVERFGPIDIDEQAQQWSGGPGTQRPGSGAWQQSQPMSQQYAQGSQETLQQGAQQRQGSQQRADTTAIPVIEEELKVGKREVDRGGVRIYQRVVETPVNESVGLREEHVNVERHPVNRPLDPADVAAFQETTIELRETAEEAVVEKTARVVEEVVVGKEVTQRNEQISDTVRRTEVEVEQIAPEDDAYFRGHWTSNYASQGGTYDAYAPAYSYGSTMARSELYRGRPWNDVENNLRTDWEARNPNSAWERVKAAVRHGWERITS